ncbi:MULTISPECIES: hypothetical protein [unclassified Solwaraspora]|uniref:hypothetical protein n=1 Tax=unclassified Solwaraspora TaxID=2627926 RepID=UPI00248B6082|nr:MULTISPECIES: hypothetical protein [unclassified Solwaraspora]WBB99550.1 hypothetical protein O7553_12055 [Solwaraspora sp. WMMA2059]WBC21900.1 hypothetical protein O7543_05320 [Solwaraspora sp. WMMA2080]WJK36055.1 hypothetical protein O7610_06810 [Solwaraspora sp. WMMA2065]
MTGAARPLPISPDRIVAGTYAVMAAISDLSTIPPACSTKRMAGVFDAFRDFWVTVTLHVDPVEIGGFPTRPAVVRSGVYLAFRSDLAPLLCLVAAQDPGRSVPHEGVDQARDGATEGRLVTRTCCAAMRVSPAGCRRWRPVARY